MVLFFCYESLSKGYSVLNEFMFQSHMRFCLTQWSATRFYGSLSVYSRPLPSEKNSPFAAQLKIAFRRFLFCDEILLAGTAVPFINKEFTGKSLLTLFCSVLKAVKKFF